MKVRFTATAFAELNDIHDHIAKDNPAAANAVIWRIEQVVGRLADFPNMAREIDPSGVRVFPVGPFPYLIFYEVQDGVLIVRNVRHGHRARETEE
jgi:addiction module RelE/StbE family toxin